MHTFSKGMKRQVFVSLALAIKPKYLFLDEPTTYLDLKHQFEILDCLVKLKFAYKIVNRLLF